MPDATSIRLRRAVAGDRESFGWVVAHFDPFVIAQVRLRLGAAAPRGEEIRDLVDEIWLVVLRKIEDLRDRDGHLTRVLIRFLVTTSFNVCNNHLRKVIAERRFEPRQNGPRDGAAPPTPTIARLAARQEGVPTQAAWREVGEAIAGALDRLDPDEVELLVLRLVEQRTHVEIAGLLGVPRNTVAVRYRRALERLRSALPRGTFAEVLSMRRA